MIISFRTVKTIVMDMTEIPVPAHITKLLEKSTTNKYPGVVQI